MTWQSFYDTITGDFVQDDVILRNASRLANWGPSPQVAEIALCFYDQQNAGQFLRLAVSKGVRFTPADLCELAGETDEDTFGLLLKACPLKMSADEFDTLEFYMDDDLRARVLKASGLDEPKTAEPAGRDGVCLNAIAENVPNAVKTPGEKPSLLNLLQDIQNREIALMEMEKLQKKLAEEKTTYVDAIRQKRRPTDDSLLADAEAELRRKRSTLSTRGTVLYWFGIAIAVFCGIFSLCSRYQVGFGLAVLAAAFLSVFMYYKMERNDIFILDKLRGLKYKPKYRTDRKTELYNQAVEEMAGQYAQNFDDQMAKLNELQTSTRQTLTKMYEAMGISPTYRGLVPVSMFCQYVEAGICDRLDGRDGAVRLYLEQTTAGQIVSKLELVANSINSNQSRLRQQLQNVAQSVEALGGNIMDGMGALQGQMAANAAMQEYYNRQVLNNQRAMRNMQAYDFWDKHLFRND